MYSDKGEEKMPQQRQTVQAPPQGQPQSSATRPILPWQIRIESEAKISIEKLASAYDEDEDPKAELIKSTKESADQAMTLWDRLNRTTKEAIKVAETDLKPTKDLITDASKAFKKTLSCPKKPKDTKPLSLEDATKEKKNDDDGDTKRAVAAKKLDKILTAVYTDTLSALKGAGNKINLETSCRLVDRKSKQAREAIQTSCGAPEPGTLSTLDAFVYGLTTDSASPESLESKYKAQTDKPFKNIKDATIKQFEEKLKAKLDGNQNGEKAALKDLGFEDKKNAAGIAVTESAVDQMCKQASKVLSDELNKIRKDQIKQHNEIIEKIRDEHDNTNLCRGLYESLDKKEKDILIETIGDRLSDNEAISVQVGEKDEATKEQILKHAKPSDFKQFQKPFKDLAPFSDPKGGFTLKKVNEKDLKTFAENVVKNAIANATEGKKTVIQITAEPKHRQAAYYAFLMAKGDRKNIEIKFAAGQDLEKGVKDTTEEQVKTKREKQGKQFKDYCEGQSESKIIQPKSRFAFWQTDEKLRDRPHNPKEKYQQVHKKNDITPTEAIMTLSEDEWEKHISDLKGEDQKALFDELHQPSSHTSTAPSEEIQAFETIKTKMKTKISASYSEEKVETQIKSESRAAYTRLLPAEKIPSALGKFQTEPWLTNETERETFRGSLSQDQQKKFKDTYPEPQIPAAFQQMAGF